MKPDCAGGTRLPLFGMCAVNKRPAGAGLAEGRKAIDGRRQIVDGGGAD
jgi:hypothetical protein